MNPSGSSRNLTLWVIVLLAATASAGLGGYWLGRHGTYLQRKLRFSKQFWELNGAEWTPQARLAGDEKSFPSGIDSGGFSRSSLDLAQKYVNERNTFSFLVLHRGKWVVET